MHLILMPFVGNQRRLVYGTDRTAALKVDFLD